MGRVLCLVFLIACGSSSSGGGDPDASGGGSHLATQCMDLCDTVLTCKGSVSSVCQEKCTSAYEHYRSEFMDAFLACFAHQCAKTQEMCTTEALPAAPRRPIDDAYFNACESRRNECSAGFSDDFCQSQLATESAVQAAMNCLAAPCAEIAGCLMTAL